MKLNPKFEEWTAVDQLLLGWTYITLTPKIASQVIGCKNSQELWKAMKDLSGAHTRSMITLLNGELHRISKGVLKMIDYSAKIKTLADNLLLAYCPISSKDLITQTLAGLDNEYNVVVVQLSDKADFSWVELQAALLTFESRLEQLTNVTTTLTAQANLATKTRSDKH